MKIAIGILIIGGLIAFTSRDRCPGDPKSLEHQSCVYDQSRGFK
jgi:hypothetical protein